MTPEAAAAVVDGVAAGVVAQFPDFVTLVLGNERLQNALSRFKDGAAAGLESGEDATLLERRLLVLKRDVVASASDSVFTIEKVFAVAVAQVVAARRAHI